MHVAHDPAGASSLTAEQRQQVAAQLESLLASSLFNQSKRYPAFLRYVVETTLHGANEELKERTIGIEVFGRQPQYDTSLDPTVRLTAAEVRKRLAQYYQQPEHAGELLITLHPGSYVPAFSWPGVPVQAVAVQAVAVQEPEDAVDEPPKPVEAAVSSGAIAWQFPWRAAIAAMAAVVLTLVVLLITRTIAARPNARSLWTPLLVDAAPVSFVLPDLSRTAYLPQPEETAKTSVLAHIRDSHVVDFNDSMALARLSGLLGRWNKPSRDLLASEATFGDLQAGPSVLIGAVDNAWTMRFLAPLPYSVAQRGSSMTFAIVGKQEAASPDWAIDLTQPFGKVQQDYGIVARLTDTMTGRPVLILAGLGQNGTAAGVRLLADPALEGRITAAAPKGWQGRNVEVVFRTQIINDEFGPPVVVAQKYW